MRRWPLSRDCAALNKNKSCAFVPGPLYAGTPVLPELWINHADTPFAWFLVARSSRQRFESNLSLPPIPCYFPLTHSLSRFSPRVISRVCVQLRLSWENERRLSLVRSFAWQLADACYRSELLNLFLRLFNAITPASRSPAISAGNWRNGGIENSGWTLIFTDENLVGRSRGSS